MNTLLLHLMAFDYITEADLLIIIHSSRGEYFPQQGFIFASVSIFVLFLGFMKVCDVTAEESVHFLIRENCFYVFILVGIFTYQNTVWHDMD